ncbi:hypothetical protein DFH08DRAFT_1050096 [Mycena albidolilacea]|uniref:Uncharacterized protein n=1 Tax=Mycena albidolilacea TaxID=1033008 RepID=A0AAD6Z6R2_9AGAR|nr:hypothetical protein DFH08DRAFT_1050096 [Mycena albidolilacea]
MDRVGIDTVHVLGNPNDGDAPAAGAELACGGCLSSEHTIAEKCDTPSHAFALSFSICPQPLTRTLARACQLPKLPIRSRAAPQHPLLVPLPDVRPPCLPEPAAHSPPPRTPLPRLCAPSRPASTSPPLALCHARPVPPPPAPASRTCLRLANASAPICCVLAPPSCLASICAALRTSVSTRLFRPAAVLTLFDDYGAVKPPASLTRRRPGAFRLPLATAPSAHIRPRLDMPMYRCNFLPYASFCPVAALRWPPSRSALPAPWAALGRPHLYRVSSLLDADPAAATSFVPRCRCVSSATAPKPPGFALLRLLPLLRCTLPRPPSHVVDVAASPLPRAYTMYGVPRLPYPRTRRLHRTLTTRRTRIYTHPALHRAILLQAATHGRPAHHISVISAAVQTASPLCPVVVAPSPSCAPLCFDFARHLVSTTLPLPSRT